MTEELEWISIEQLLFEYSIPVLAEAVEKLNVQTHDSTGRRILATDGDKNDLHSKAFALRHLSIRHSMLEDPGPDDYLLDEKLEIEGSPLDSFGWPMSEFPDFTKLQPHYQPDDSLMHWTKRSPAEFEKEFISAGKNFTKAGELHGISRQRYAEVIKSKCRPSLFERN